MSIAKTFTATHFGLDALPVEIEADLSNGLPSFNIVGLPDKAVEESKERVRAAIKNSGLLFPQRRITINLAPADLKKEGPIFDLAIAVALLMSAGQIEGEMKDKIFLGELSLDGRLRHTAGILPVAHYSRENKIKEIYIPAENLKEASIIDGLEIYPLNNLFELYLHLKGEKLIEPVLNKVLPESETEEEVDFFKI